MHTGGTAGLLRRWSMLVFIVILFINPSGTKGALIPAPNEAEIDVVAEAESAWAAPDGAIAITTRNAADVSTTMPEAIDVLPSDLLLVENSLQADTGTARTENGTITWEGYRAPQGQKIIRYLAEDSAAATLRSTIENELLAAAESADAIAQLTPPGNGVICRIQKYADNPVLEPGPDGSWDSAYVGSPTVIRSSNGYRMWYTGSDGTSVAIGLATSSDGREWTKYGENPVYTPSETQSLLNLFGTSVLHVDPYYFMWYSVVLESGEMSIGYAVSQDGIYWVDNGIILRPDETQAWRSRAVSQPSVIYTGDQYRMWFVAYDGVTKRIGHAWANEPWETWQVSPEAPVVDIGVPGGWSWLNVDHPAAVAANDGIILWYSGETRPYRIETGYTTLDTPDRLSFSGHLLRTGEAGSFDSRLAEMPTVLANGSAYDIWYSGKDDAFRSSIGYATAEVCRVGDIYGGESVYLPIVDSNLPCGPYYIDGFSDPTSGWPVAEIDNGSVGYEDETYRIQFSQPGFALYMSTGLKADDFTISVELWHSTVSNGVAGILLGGINEAHHGYAVLLDHHRYNVAYVDEEGIDVLPQWHESTAILAPQERNLLTVIRKGTEVVVYVNGQELTAFRDEADTDLRLLGLLAWPTEELVEVHLDNFMFGSACPDASVSSLTNANAITTNGASYLNFTQSVTPGSSQWNPPILPNVLPRVNRGFHE